MKSQFKEKISDDLLRKIKGKSWYRHGIYRDNLLCSVLILPGLLTKFFKREGISRTFDYLKINNDAYITQNDYEDIKELMLKKIEMRKGYLEDYIINYRKDNQKVILYSQEIKKKKVEGLKNKELAKLFECFRKKTVDLSHWLWSMEFLNGAVDDFLRIKIKELRPEWQEKQVDDFLLSTSFFRERLPFQRELDEVIKLDKLDLNNKEKLSQLHKKYAWLNLNTWEGRPFNFDEYRKRLMKMIENKKDINRRIKERDNKVREAKRLIEGIADKNLKKSLATVQKLIYLKTERIDVYSISWYNVQNLIREICRRIDVSYQNLLKLTPEEIISLLLTKERVPQKEFIKRENFVVIFLNNGIHYFYGDTYKKIKDILGGKDYSDITELKGTIAFGGVAKGIARVLLTDKDLPKIKKGDILIANLTNPNYNPAFEKIIGVVTDEGGILCHSAIMAREFRIPCIIGTKIATKVLKDGDLVEVDANKGMVEILKRK